MHWNRMRCPDCDQSLTVHESFYDDEFVCESCGFHLPRGAD